MKRRALAALLVLAAGCHAPGAGTRTERREWWFPGAASAGTELRYHVDYTSDWTLGTSTQHRVSGGDFTLEFVEEPGQPGILARMSGEPGGAGDAALWLQWFRQLNEEGVRVTDRDVWIGEVPLVRGPWREGDRLSFGGLIFFVNMALHVVHAQVVSAAPGRVELAFQLWMGDPVPHSRGSGEVVLESDAVGITHMSLHWDLVSVTTSHSWIKTPYVEGASMRHEVFLERVE